MSMSMFIGCFFVNLYSHEYIDVGNKIIIFYSGFYFSYLLMSLCILSSCLTMLLCLASRRLFPSGAFVPRPDPRDES